MRTDCLIITLILQPTPIYGIRPLCTVQTGVYSGPPSVDPRLWRASTVAVKCRGEQHGCRQGARPSDLPIQGAHTRAGRVQHGCKHRSHACLGCIIGAPWVQPWGSSGARWVQTGCGTGRYHKRGSKQMLNGCNSGAGRPSQAQHHEISIKINFATSAALQRSTNQDQRASAPLAQRPRTPPGLEN